MHDEALADAETKVWQAYYLKDSALVQVRLETLYSLQFAIDRPDDCRKVATAFAAAYLKFGEMAQDSKQESYDNTVLPHVINAYETLRTIIAATWNAKDAATADLSWWIARRDESTLNPEIVAQRMGLLFYVLYGTNDQGHFKRAAYLRATAGHYRDICQDKLGGVTIQDWVYVNSILRNAYQELHNGAIVNKPRKSPSPPPGKTPAL